MGGGKSKKVLQQVGQSGAQKKQPKRVADLRVGEDIDQPKSNPCWSFQYMDREYDGEWDWKLSENEHDDLFNFLKTIQLSTWMEIRAQTYNGKQGKRYPSHHPMPTDALCQEAKERLHDLQLGECEELFRFRLGTSIRLWGAFVQASHEFHIIWWDRNHRVYPL